MKKIIFLFLSVSIFFVACKTSEKKMNNNPLLNSFETPFGIPSFEKIQNKHYLPAFKESIKTHDAEIEAIVNLKEAPDFKNTIEALDFSGILLTDIGNIFFALKSSHTNDSIDKIAEEISPLLAGHQDDIALNVALFQKVKAVYDKKETLQLNTEQSFLLKKTYDRFVRGGANLPAEKKERLREINQKLSVLTLKFGDNLLKENNAFELLLEKVEDLAGLPESVISGAKEAAESKGYKGKWLFTLDNPSRIPFLTYSEKRELREKIYKGYLQKGDNNNANDNKAIIKEIITLRQEKANLLGYTNYAEFVIDENMAKTPEEVFKLLNKVWKSALPAVKKEADELQKMIYFEGNKYKLEGWDWWYYSEKVRKAKYDLDEEALRPYFELENVKAGMYMLANKLYGITFEPIKNAPLYHTEAQAYEVKEADGKHIGVFYTDPYPRESKRGGAWMTNIRDQYIINGKDTRPIVMNVTNFSRPTGTSPSLLTFDEVLTMFHEFGHGLHGLLSNCNYRSLSGTSVPRDFVEFPSQIMENWAAEPEMLKLYAKHYKTGEVIPDELIQKIQNSKYFNQGFATAEYTAAALLDMYWHTLSVIDENFDVNAFENKVKEDIGLIPEVAFRYRSTYFAHIFSGEYAAGYYVYQWAAVMEADGFEAFKEKGLFDKKTGLSLREHIISKGSTDDAMKMYIDFRGKEPSIEPFLRRSGFIN